MSVETEAFSNFDLGFRDLELEDIERRAWSGEVRPVRVALLGYGRVGQAVAARAEAERTRLNTAGVDLSCRHALVRNLGKPRGGPTLTLSDSATAVLNEPADIVVEALGGVEPARTFVKAALDAGVPVVSANKSLVARHGQELSALAQARGTTFAFDAAVIAGVPFVGSLSRRPLVSAISRIEGIVNGTSAFVLNEIGRGTTFATALAEAVGRGYAEPDSAADTSGLDAAEKLTILLHLCGRHDVRVDDLPRLGIDVLEPADFAGAAALGGTIKPVALASIDDDEIAAWIGPAFVTDDHPFARLEGVTNSLRLTSTSGDTMTFTGPGAGPDVTAATIIDDVVETIQTRNHSQVLGIRQRALDRKTACLRPWRSPWFLRLDKTPGFSLRRIAEVLAAHHAPPLQVTQRDHRIHARVESAPATTIHNIIRALEARGVQGLALPMLTARRRG